MGARRIPLLGSALALFLAVTRDLVAESHAYLGTCPTCVAEGETSKVVWREEGPSTSIPWQPFTDENGWVHEHDPNANMHIFECTRGHEWSGIQRKACWCGWGRDD
jgi:hypothetical protein